MWSHRGFCVFVLTLGLAGLCYEASALGYRDIQVENLNPEPNVADVENLLATDLTQLDEDELEALFLSKFNEGVAKITWTIENPSNAAVCNVSVQMYYSLFARLTCGAATQDQQFFDPEEVSTLTLLLNTPEDQAVDSCSLAVGGVGTQVLFGGLVINACSESGIEEEITSSSDVQLNTWQTGDDVAWSNKFTEDGVWDIQGEPPVIGRAAIAARSAQYREDGLGYVEKHVVAVTVLGPNYAYDRSIVPFWADATKTVPFQTMRNNVLWELVPGEGWLMASLVLYEDVPSIGDPVPV